MSRLNELNHAVNSAKTMSDKLSIVWLDKAKHIAQFRISNKKLKKRVTGNVQHVGDTLRVKLHRSDYDGRYARKKVRSILESAGIARSGIVFLPSVNAISNSDPGPGDTIIAFSDIIPGIFEGQTANISAGDAFNALNDESISCTQQILSEDFQVRVERIFIDTCDASTNPSEFTELTILL